MLAQRIKKNCRIKLGSLKHTNIGINERIPNYLGKTGRIKNDSKNLNFCSNNTLITMDDGFAFWVSHKDLIDLSVGVNLTFNKVLKIINKLHLDKDPIKIVSNIYHDFLKGTSEEEIAKKYKIEKSLISEIYFLFNL